MTDEEFDRVLTTEFESENGTLHDRQRAGATVSPRPIAIIHGPPGTGKSLVSGVTATEEILTAGRPRRLLLTGPTTRAVRELYGAFAEAWTTIAPAVTLPGGSSPRVRARLLTGTGCTPIDIPDRSPVIDHDEVNYRNGTAAGSVHDALTVPRRDVPTVLAGTPGKVDRFVDQMPGSATEDRWDTVICDEASMIDAATLSLTTGPLVPFAFDGVGSRPQSDGPGGRLYLVGDHRQLPVIRKADWTAIRRPGADRHQPQAPALDLVRYLHGHEVEFQTPSTGGQRGLGQDAITYVPLERSYRMHTVIAEHLQPVYARDDLTFYSEETATLPSRATAAPTAGLETATLPGPLTVIRHDDTRGDESNPTEADIVAGLTDDLGETFPDRSIGIVTPHNAQKTLLRRTCPDGVDTVDTVEGFQGAGEDILLASLTVASEAAQDSKERWLLDHRRLNVALSRAREKLVVVVPQSLLDYQPDKLSTARDAQVLADLEQRVREVAEDTTGHATTNTTVEELVGPVLPSLRSHGAATVDVYTHPDTV